MKPCYWEVLAVTGKGSGKPTGGGRRVARALGGEGLGEERVFVQSRGRGGGSGIAARKKGHAGLGKGRAEGGEGSGLRRGGAGGGEAPSWPGPGARDEILSTEPGGQSPSGPRQGRGGSMGGGGSTTIGRGVGAGDDRREGGREKERASGGD